MFFKMKLVVFSFVFFFMCIPTLSSVETTYKTNLSMTVIDTQMRPITKMGCPPDDRGNCNELFEIANQYADEDFLP